MPSTLVNYKNCVTGQGGTGLIDCEQQWGVPSGFIRVPKSWELDPTATAFDQAYIESQIKAGTFVPFLNAISFEPSNQEAEIFTTQTKVDIKTIDGKSGYVFEYSNGYHFHRSAFQSNSFNKYNVLVVYDGNVIVGAETSTGTIKGQQAGLLNTSNWMDANGSDPSKTRIMFQLTNPSQYNKDLVALDGASNSFDIDEITGVVDVTLTKVSNSTTDVVLTAVATANKAVNITGLVAGDFRAIGTSETVSSLAYDDALNQYTLTFSGDVSGDYATMTIQLYDSGDSTLVVKSGNVLYKGQTA